MPVFCPQCHKTFLNDAMLIEHILTNDSCLGRDIPYGYWEPRTCWCGRSISNSVNAMNAHFKQCGGVEQHYLDCLMGRGRVIEKCPVCGAEFYDPIELARHLLCKDFDCMPMQRHIAMMREWKRCWCNNSVLLSAHIQGDPIWLVDHLRDNGGAEKHYADCLMGLGGTIIDWDR